MRKRAAHVLAVLSGVILSGSPALPQGTVWTFDDLPGGQPPAGFAFAEAGRVPSGAWTVLRDGSNGVLAHAPRAPAGAAIAVAEGIALDNVAVSARLRFTDGPGAAGLVWRYRDPANHYLMTLDLEAQDVRIHRVARGNRTRLEQEDDLELHVGDWHTVKVEHRGTRIRVWINGVPVADARDRSGEETGAIGVWTRGGSAVWFDDLRVGPAPEPARGWRRH